MYEYEIKKSKFISYIFYVENTSHQKNIIEELKKQYSDATHICYAYVIKEDGIKEKAFDDGEPSGTAGKPILECIKKNKLILINGAVIMKIKQLSAESFMLFDQINMKFSDNINVIFGENSTGKTALLKTLYSTSKLVADNSNAIIEEIKIVSLFIASQRVGNCGVHTI